MNTTLGYCPNRVYVLLRLERHSGQDDQQVPLVLMNMPSDAVEEFKKNHEAGFCGYPSALSILRDLRKQTGEIPLICTVKFEQFVQSFVVHSLVGGVFYDVLGVADIDTANRCMDSVRKYKA
jgi:hypothetical protein